MHRPRTGKPVEWRQLCAIARAVITSDRSIEDGEWKERIKDRLIALDLDYPLQLDLFPRAMSAVETALEKQWGPRPASLPLSSTRPPETSQTDPPWRGQRRASSEWTSIQELLQRLVENTQR